MSLPAFNTVNDILEQADSMLDAAETHGFICGFLCGGKPTDGKNWMEPLLGIAELAATNEIRHMLLALYNTTHTEIMDVDFSFQLLIPEDEQPLAVRVQSLSHWCQGFLTGIGLTGAYIDEQNAEEAQDILYHFDDIAKLDYENIEPGTENEKAYFELFEYVRMAVLVIYNELAIPPTGMTDSSIQHLH